MTNADYAAALQDAVNELSKHSWSSKTHTEGLTLLITRLQAGEVDVAGIVAMDKAALRNVSDEALEFARSVVLNGRGATKLDMVNSISREQSRRKAAATKAVRAAEQSARQASGTAFEAGEKAEVHAFGHWYPGEVVRTTRTGSVVVRYTSGTGATREKTVGAEKVRKLGK